MKKRVLVTGACGFIGSHLLDILVEQECEVVALDILFHNNAGNVEHLAGKFELSRTDIRDRAAIEKVFAEFRPEHVYHLAAHHFIPYCNQHPQEAIETNITGTQNLADACSAHDIDRVFFASTAAVYGVSDHPHVETESPNPLDIYGVTKAAGEKIMQFLARGSNVKVRIGRYFNAVGNRETNPHILPEIVNQLSANPTGPLYLGNVSPKRDYIHASDLADASFTMMNHQNAESFDIANLGSGSESSVEELVELFNRALKRQIIIKSDPQRTRKNDRPHLCADTTRLRQRYGWTPKHSLNQAIGELAATIEAKSAMTESLT